MAVSRLKQLIDDAKNRRGRWRLTRDHEIEYRGDGPHEEFRVRGPVVAVEPGRLVFSATEKTSGQKTVTRLIKLNGEWKADAKNRIVFTVEREAGRRDQLTFSSNWHLNNRYDIVYTYRTTALKTRRRLERELVFSGHWDLSERKRLAFLIGSDDRSRLRFRGAFQTPSILAKSGEIRYQAGFEGRAGRQTRTLAFFGKWKVSRRFGLSFELETGEKKKRLLNFVGEWNLDDARRMAVSLHSPAGDPLGLEVLFSRDFFEDGEFFVRLARTAAEARVEAGARWTR